MTRQEKAWYSFYEMAGALRRFKIWLPLLVYALIKILIMLFYLVTVRGALNSFWSLLTPESARGGLGHYPTDLLLMPVIMNRVDIVLDLLVHVIFQGAVIVLFFNALKDKPLSVPSALSAAGRRYLPLVAVNAIAAAALFLTFYLPTVAEDLSPFRLPYTLLTYGPTVFALIVQTFFVFTMPLVLLSGASVFGALGGSFKMAWTAFANTFALVLVPFLFTLLAIYLESQSEVLVSKLAPEILVQIQIVIELTHWIATVLLLGAVTANYIRRSGQ